MELLLAVAALVLFATPAMALYAAYKVRVLSTELESLRTEVRRTYRSARAASASEGEAQGQGTQAPTHAPASDEALRTRAETPAIVWPKSRSTPAATQEQAPTVEPESVTTGESEAGPTQEPSPEKETEQGGAAPGETPTPEPDRPFEKDREPAMQPAAATLDFETLIGSTWLLRLGLGILAIALALFARSIAPQLTPAAKVALAYAGSLAFFGVGVFFEERLAKFARPVMAGGLSFGFFVAFAAHFVPAMQAISMPVSIVWMVFSMLTVLAAAERWQSEPTAILAIVLGNISALVAAGDADMYSLVMIAFLAFTAIVLLLRHEWVALGLAGATISYGTHLLWLVSGRDSISGDEGFWLNLAFLTSYYVIFLIADVLWWRRGSERTGDLSPEVERQARALGPTNLVLYVALTTFVYVTSGTGLESIEWYFLSLGAVQGILAWLYKDANHRDFVFYPVFGTVLWTLGMFAAFDALALNTILAAQALILLLAAHRTGLRVFHGLAQVAMAVAFVHYLVYPPPIVVTLPLFVAGIAVAGIYLLKASLEELWYGDGTLGPIWSFVAPAHAILGGIVIVREAFAYFGDAAGLGAFLTVAELILLGIVLVRIRPVLLFALTTLAVGAASLAGLLPSMSAWLLLVGLVVTALVLVLVAADRFDENTKMMPSWHAQGIGALAVVGGYAAAAQLDVGLGRYVPWMIVPLLMLFFQHQVDERAPALGLDATKAPDGTKESDGSGKSVGSGAPTVGAAWKPSTHTSVATVMYVAIAVLVIALTAAGVGRVYTAPVWIAFWVTAIIAASSWRTSRGLFIAAYTLLVGGYMTFLFRSTGDRMDFSALASLTLSSWWAGAVVVFVALAVAVGIDRRLDAFRPSLDPTQWWAALFLTFLPYGLGLLIIGEYAGVQLPFGWSYFMPAFVGLLLIWNADRFESPRGVVAVVVATALWHVHLLFGGRTAAIDVALLPLLFFVITTLAMERAVLSWVTSERDHRWRSHALATLVVLATLTAMLAVYESSLFGPTWATAGWSILGGSMMAAGFGLKSTLHRRVALALLGICVIRVFTIDTVGLSDTARIGAFFVLGMILVAIAWLYSRYSEELKKLL